jgi:hypothetical protein
MGIANYIDKKIAKEKDFDAWRVRTLRRVQEDALKWWNAASPKERKRLYSETGVRHSVLMELEYWDPTTMVPVDGMHLFFIGLLQYHAQTVLRMDLAGSKNKKVSSTTLKQVEDARAMLLHTGTESPDLNALTVDVLKILCEERGINLKQSPHKGNLIESLKVRATHSQRLMNSHGCANRNHSQLRKRLRSHRTLLARESYRILYKSGQTSQSC